MGRSIREAGEEKQEDMMSMTRRTTAHMHPAVDAAPRIDVVQSDKEALTGGRFTALWESAAQQILAVTYWVDSAPHPRPHPVSRQVFRRRAGLKGRASPCGPLLPGATIEGGIPA